MNPERGVAAAAVAVAALCAPSNASTGGPHENPMNDAVGCSRRMERVELVEGVLACIDAASAETGDDSKRAEKAKGRDASAGVSALGLDSDREPGGSAGDA